MFQMSGCGGARCPRCDHKNTGEALYRDRCDECGLTLGAPRSAAVLRDNRWIPGPDDLAVFFGVRALSGLFVKTLRVPATSRAYILQADKATEVPQGEYEIEGFFTRLNHLLRNGHAEILITRSAALPVAFAFDDLRSAEYLALSASFTVSVQIEQVAAFARHFMTLPGTVTVEHLRELLAPSVRQLAAEFVAAQSLRDMADNPALRAQLDERLQGALKLRLSQYGLAVAQVDTLVLRHDRFDASRERIGTLWLVVDERCAELEHAKRLDELYDAGEWQRLRREEQQSRLRYRRAALRQDEAVERAELSLQNSERVQAVRAREIDLYGRIVEANSRKQAIERGAGDVLTELEHAHAKKGAARGDEAAEWAHLRELAGIRMRTELEIAQQESLEARQMAQQRFSHRLLLQQIDNKVVQATLIEDEARKRSELEGLHLHQQAAARRQCELDAEAHKASWQSISLVTAAHKREAERVQEWEQQVALERRRDLLRGSALLEGETQQKLNALQRASAQAESIAQYDKLRRTIEADGVHSRQAQQLALDGEQARHAMKRQAQEAEWQQELRRLEHQREDKFAHLAHVADLARIDVARVEAIGAMSDTAKVALAAAPNAAALAGYMTSQVHGAMSAQQLAALAAVVAASNGVTPQEAARLADERQQREAARRDVELDQDRRHQLGLLTLQNDVNKAALASQAQLGVGVGAAPAAAAARQCANGHAASGAGRFCAQCGAALPA